MNGKRYLVLLQGTGGSNSGRKCSSHQSDKEHEKGVRAFTHRTLDQSLHYLFRRTCWAVGITIAITESFLRQMHISSIKFVQTSLFACESRFFLSAESLDKGRFYVVVLSFRRWRPLWIYCSTPKFPTPSPACGSIPDLLLTALKEKKDSISFEQNSAKFHAFFMRIFQ